MKIRLKYKSHNIVLGWNEDQKNLGFLILCSVLLFLNFSFPNDVLSAGLTLLLSVYVFLCPQKVCLPTVIYLSMFAALFRFERYNLYVLLCLAFIGRIVLRNRVKSVNALLIMGIYLLTHLCSTQLSTISVGDIFPVFAFFCLYVGCVYYRNDQRNACLVYFITGHLVSSMLGIFKKYTRLRSLLDEDFVTRHEWRDTVRFSGLSYDSNFYTMAAIIAVGILLFYLNEKQQWLWTVALGLVSLFGFMTYSKSFYICYIFLMIGLFSKSSRKTRHRIFKFLPLAFLLVFVFRDRISDVLMTFWKRFEQVDTINGLTTGRIELWGYYIEGIFHSVYELFFGHGISAAVVLPNGAAKAAHNTFLEILYKFGLFGGLIDSLYFAICFKSRGRKLNKLWVNYLMITLLILLCFNLSAYTFRAFWSCIIVVWIVCTQEKPPLEICEGERCAAK